MKAIHNTAAYAVAKFWVGNYKLKYNFESNSQQEGLHLVFSFVGNYKLKYNFESNSQHAGHWFRTPWVGNYKLKYNFESNSQQIQPPLLHPQSWEL